MRQETEQENWNREMRRETKGGLRTALSVRKQNRRIARREMIHETEQEVCEERNDTGNRTGGLRRER